MLTLDHVKTLTETMVSCGLTVLDVKGNDYTIRLLRTPDAVSTMVDAGGAMRETKQARSPATGLFCARGFDDGLAPLAPYARVHAGEPVGYIGIGPVRILCLSPATGRLVAPPPPDGQTATRGDPLFTVEIAP